MQIIIEKKAGSKVDITGYIEGVTLKGDYKSVARSLDIKVLYPTIDKNIAKQFIEVGDKIAFLAYGLQMFNGVVWDKALDTSNEFMNITAFDDLIYLTKSDVAKVYKNVTPQAVTAQLAQEFDIPTGYLCTASTARNYVALAKKPYDVIMAAYTHASKTTGLKYMPRMMNKALHVLEKGASVANVILDGRYNLENAKYTQSLEGMVNSVIVYKSEDGSHSLKEQNSKDIEVYGVLQKAISYVKDEDNKSLAKKELKPIERKASVKAMGHPMCLAGNMVHVKDDHTGLVGKFYIDSDTHTWSKGVHSMQLELNFENLMDEKELEEEIKKQEEAKAKEPAKPSTSKPKPSTSKPSTSKPKPDWVFEHTDCAGHGANPH